MSIENIQINQYALVIPTSWYVFNGIGTIRLKNTYSSQIEVQVGFNVKYIEKNKIAIFD